MSNEVRRHRGGFRVRTVGLVLIVTVLAAGLIAILLRNDTGRIRTSRRLPLSAGELLAAETTVGSIEIEATSATDRIYRWGDGCERSASLAYATRTEPADQLMFPGLGDHWDECGGVRRAVLQEGVKNFATIAEFETWRDRMTTLWNKELGRPQGTRFYAYSDAGVVIGWGIVRERKQLDVEVWRVLIDGAPTRKLPGAENERIQIRKDRSKSESANR